MWPSLGLCFFAILDFPSWACVHSAGRDSLPSSMYSFLGTGGGQGRSEQELSSISLQLQGEWVTVTDRVPGLGARRISEKRGGAGKVGVRGDTPDTGFS